MATPLVVSAVYPSFYSSSTLAAYRNITITFLQGMGLDPNLGKDSAKLVSSLEGGNCSTLGVANGTTGSDDLGPVRLEDYYYTNLEKFRPNGDGETIKSTTFTTEVLFAGNYTVCYRPHLSTNFQSIGDMLSLEDKVAPFIIKTHPRNGDINVSLSTVIVLEFSERVWAGQGNIIVSPVRNYSNHGLYNASRVIDPSSKYVNISKSYPWTASISAQLFSAQEIQSYLVRIEAGAFIDEGYPLQNKNEILDYEFQFNVVDAKAPVVLSHGVVMEDFTLKIDLTMWTQIQISLCGLLNQ
jgi:hypothetical protein